MSNFKLDGRTIAIGVVVLLVVVLIGSQVLNRRDAGTTEVPQDDDAAFGINDNVNTDANTELGRLVTASSLDADSCPVNTTSEFARSDTVYVVLEESQVPQGTNMFARLFQDGQPVEDTPVITADRDYTNTCVYFEFEASRQAEVLQPGEYEAQLVINGNPTQTIDFVVR